MTVLVARAGLKSRVIASMILTVRNLAAAWRTVTTRGDSRDRGWVADFIGEEHYGEGEQAVALADGYELPWSA